MNREQLRLLLNKYFQWLCEHPECSFDEKETTAFIRSVLEENGIEILDLPFETGLVARISCPDAEECPVVALRCEIDALPNYNKSDSEDLPKFSDIENRFEHSFNTAAMLGSALLLNRQKTRLGGSVILIFQHASKMSAGAKQIMAHDVLGDVEEIYGQCANPSLESGTVGICKDVSHAATSRMVIQINDIGSELDSKQISSGPVAALAALISSIQCFCTCRVDLLDMSDVEITRLEGGSVWNTAPTEIYVEGIIKAFKTETRMMVTRHLSDICSGIGNAYHVSIRIDFDTEIPATDNDPVLCDMISDIAGDLEIPVTTVIPSLSGNDFSVYQVTIPGAYWDFGIANAQGLNLGGANGDSAHIINSAELMAAMAINSLIRLSDENEE